MKKSEPSKGESPSQLIDARLRDTLMCPLGIADADCPANSFTRSPPLVQANVGIYSARYVPEPSALMLLAVPLWRVCRRRRA